MLPRVTLIFIQCRKVRSLAKKALASVRRRVAIFFGWRAGVGVSGGGGSGQGGPRRMFSFELPGQLGDVGRRGCPV